jgi:hypothetical protein
MGRGGLRAQCGYRRGALRHDKLGEKSEALPPAGSTDGERIHSRSVTLTSDQHRLIAAIDLVEGEDRLVSPVDDKRGSPRDREGALEAWPADRAQVCAQALVLRDNGYTCDEAVVYYNATKQRGRTTPRPSRCGLVDTFPVMTRPLFGARVSYRRALEIQARLPIVYSLR